MARFTDMDHRRALMMYMDHMNITKIAKQMGTTRQTITKWKCEGYPVSITGGKDWKLYRETDIADQTRKAITRHADDQVMSSLEFFEQAKVDIIDVYEKLRLQLLAGEAEPKYSDMEKLLNVFVRLDNQAADRVLWMQDVMTQMIKAVAKIITDERIFLQVRNEFIGIAAAQQKELGPIPGQVELPTPAEIGVGVELVVPCPLLTE